MLYERIYLTEVISHGKSCFIRRYILLEVMTYGGHDLFFYIGCAYWRIYLTLEGMSYWTMCLAGEHVLCKDILLEDMSTGNMSYWKTCPIGGQVLQEIMSYCSTYFTEHMLLEGLLLPASSTGAHRV